MKDQRILIVTLVVSMLISAVIFVSMRNRSDIDIEISEDEDEWSLYASFPSERSEEVSNYLKSRLKMTDLTDLRHLEIERYETPDGKMRFHIKSNSGYVRIVMDRKENSRDAYVKLKKAAEGLSKLLTHPEDD